MLLRKLLLSLVVVIAGFSWTETGHAQATRTWVSGVGDDANPCSRTAPCKTFAGAISKTASQGEIDCLDPGGFGALTITKPITIDCENTSNGGVLVAGTNGIVISTTGAVNLIGLDFNGLGPGGTAGLSGVNILSAGNVNIRNCKIYGFNTAGINVAPSASGGNVVVDNVVLMTNAIGINVNGSSGIVNTAVVHSTLYNNSTANIEVQTTGSHAGATIANSTLAYSAGAGLLMNGGAAVAVISNNTITGNGTGVSIQNGTVFTLKNNAIAGNSNDVNGTLAAYPGGLQ